MLTFSLCFFSYFKEPIDIYCQFIPQMLFLGCLFIYLCLLIIYKWLKFSVYHMQTTSGKYWTTACAPSLLVGFINMFMMKTRPDSYYPEDAKIPEGGSVPRNAPDCNLAQMYSGQVVFLLFFRM